MITVDINCKTFAPPQKLKVYLVYSDKLPGACLIGQTGPRKEMPPTSFKMASFLFATQGLTSSIVKSTSSPWIEPIGSRFESTERVG